MSSATDPTETTEAAGHLRFRINCACNYPMAQGNKPPTYTEKLIQEHLFKDLEVYSYWIKQFIDDNDWTQDEQTRPAKR